MTTKRKLESCPSSAYMSTTISKGSSKIFLVILLHALIGTASSLNVTINGPSELYEGDSISLRCSIENSTINATTPVEWYKDNFVFSGENGTYYNKTNSTASDNGTYHCSVGGSNSPPYSLTVLWIDELVLNGTKQLNEGQELVLSCMAKGIWTNIVYKWFKDDIQQNITTQNFQIVNVTRHDTGRYSCSVSIGAEEKLSTAAYVNVTWIDQPTVNGTKLLKEGEELVLSCMAKGNPNYFDYQWFRDEKQQNIETQNFRIANVVRNDTGSYSCNVSNSAGEKQSSAVYVNVTWIDQPIVNETNLLKEGQELVLSCMAKGNPNYFDYQWFKDDTQQNITTQNFRIANVIRNDTGSYSCNVSNSAGKKQSSAVYVNVTWIDQPIVNGTKLLKEGQELVLSCMAKGNPNYFDYQWFKVEKQQNIETQNFRIANVTRNDTGSYSCNVSNSAGEKQSSTVYVNVTYLSKPKIEGTLTMVEGQNLELHCKVDGNPSNIIYSWFMNGTLLSDESKNTFSIHASSRNDSGYYRCNAKNSFGNLSSEPVEVRIKWSDKPYIKSSAGTFDVKEHSSMSLKCQAVSTQVIITKYEWYFNNETVHTENSSEYSFSNINRNSTGLYSCRTSFTNGFRNETSQAIFLNVTWIDTPSIIGQETIKEGVNLTLQCNASGNPQPAVFRWLKNDIQEISTNENYLMRDARRTDAGNYTCVTNNSFGSKSSKIFSLDVYWLDTPKVTGTNKINESGPAVELKCNVTGNPRVSKFEWFENGSVINGGTNETFTITSNRMNRGSYSCDATNEFGTKQSPSHHVEVLWIDAPTMKPSRFSVFENNRLFIKEEEIMELECLASGFPKHFTYEWFKIDKSTQTPRRLSTGSDTFSKFRMQRNDTGSYACATTNEGGYVSSRFISVDVWWLSKPIINSTVTPTTTTTNSVSISIKEGDSLSLSCWSIGYPNNIDYKWFKGDKKVHSSRTLRISSTPAYDANFSCEAGNKFGIQKSKTISISVTPKEKGTEDKSSNRETIVGLVVGFLTIIVILLIALYYVARKQRYQALSSNISLKPMAKSNMGVSVLQHEVPVPKETFKEHLSYIKANGNFLLSQQYAVITSAPEHTHNHSLENENVAKNRYANVSAYDDTRVKLDTTDGLSDYVNANYIRGYDRNREYIAAQGPLPETVYDFWRMVWEQESTTVVMLTNIEESGRVKCEKYWPDEGTMRVDDITISILDMQIYSDFVVRTFTLKKSKIENEEEDGGLTVKQFHFTAWPDFGVPTNPSSVLGFMRNVSKWNNLSQTPMVVHCSAGVGRTGTYITIESQIKHVKASNDLTIFSNVVDLRTQRNLMVQTEAQYAFVHEAIMEYLQSGETEVPVSQLKEYIKRKSTVDSSSGSNGFFREFVHLSKQQLPQQTFNEASKNANSLKNLYKNVLPYDQSRVKLSPIPGVEGSDYINASFLSSFTSDRSFIACQHPLKKTVEDFWRMIWETKSGIIMNIREPIDMKKQALIAEYWPTDDDAVVYGDIIISLVSESETTEQGYTDKELNVHNSQTKETRSVRLFHITSWSDREMTSLGSMLISVIGHMHKHNNAIGNHPVTVHCSAGVGRAGVLIGLSNVIEQAKSLGMIDIYSVTKAMRQQRPAMVQTKEQYEFLYEAVQEYLGSFDLLPNNQVNHSYDDEDVGDDVNDDVTGGNDVDHLTTHC